MCKAYSHPPETRLMKYPTAAHAAKNGTVRFRQTFTGKRPFTLAKLRLFFLLAKEMATFLRKAR